jgi:hypothetical protein
MTFCFAHGFGKHCRHIRLAKASRRRFEIAKRLTKREKTAS